METLTWMKGISRERLMDNITLLWTLNEIPDIPEEIILPKESDAVGELTIEREKSLVENLAFLSAATDDMSKVMAVCVEEDPDREGVTIRMASNTECRAEILDGFKKITRVLEQAALQSLSP
jgi:hypothetical protein